MTKVLVAESRPIVRLGLTTALARAHDVFVVGLVDPAKDLSKEVTRTKAAALILDVPPSDASTFDLLRDLRKRHPALKILVFTDLDEDVFGERALRAGANGYLMRSASIERLLESLRVVVRGGMAISDAMSARVLQRFGAHAPPPTKGALDGLSDRELEVFEQLTHGRTSQQIAKSLGLSLKTVQTHRENVRSKLGLESTAALLHFAAQYAARAN